LRHREAIGLGHAEAASNEEQASSTNSKARDDASKAFSTDA
jgi:hypothetical protein